MAIGTPTNGSDTLFFQGTVQHFTFTLTNPYSGETIFVDEEKNVNTGSYDALGGSDVLLMSDFGDVLFLDDGSGNALVANLESVLAGNGGDVLIFSSPTLTYGNVLLDGGNNDDIIWGNVGNDVLNGKAGDDRIDGGPGDDLLRGGADNDTLRGGDGNDTVNGEAGNDTLFGDAGNDTLNGGTEDDVLSGGAGNDSLIGGAGVDTASWQTSPAAVSADLLAGMASDGFGGTDTLLTIENLTGSDYDDLLKGDAANNILTGGAGNDTLIGEGGNDTLDGGAGVDTADYLNAAAGVTVDLMAGTANDGLGGTDALVGIENVVGSVFADTLGGDGTDNVLTGGQGDDILVGAGGNDTLDGGAGVDKADYLNAAAGVTVDLMARTANDGLGGTDTLVGIENVVGSAFADTLTGDGAENVLTGGQGDDILVGAGGNDTLDGGAGVDTADYAASGSGIVADLGTGLVSDGLGGTDTLVGIENVVGSAFDDMFRVNAQDNGFAGGAGVDTVDYSGITAGVTVDLMAGVAADGLGGTDSLSGIEIVIGSAFADTLGGDGADNVLTGGQGDDTLIGAGGNDTLDGGAGVDTADYGHATGPIVGNLSAGMASDGFGGTDTLVGIEDLAGSAQADELRGDAGVNVIEGRGGADILDGRENDDTLQGGDGADTVYGGAGNDVIEGAEGDDILFGGTGGDDSGFVHITTHDHAFSDDVVLPDLIERRELGAPDALGIAAGDLAPGFATTATIRFVESGAGYNNSLGHYTVGADGTITGVEMDFANIKATAAGTERTVAVSGAAGSSIGLFVLSNGYNVNGGYGGLDLGNGYLKFVYKVGTGAERAAKITDAARDVSLVYDDGVHEKVLRGDVFHSTTRGDGAGLNRDGKVHVVSGIVDDTPVNLNPQARDLRGNRSSFTRDGITISVEDPLAPGLHKGTLSWQGGHDGEGIGIKSNGSNKIWKPGEVIGIDLTHDASKVVVTLADIDRCDRNDGIDFKLYLAGHSTPVTGEVDLGTLPVVDGLVRLTFDAADFGGPGALIQGVDLFSMVGSSGLGAASFLINNVQAIHPADMLDTGTLRVGFEDLRGLGDADYNDVVVDVRIAGAPGEETVLVADNDTIDGGAGHDVIDGGYGNDLLIGGQGNDTLYGGQGADTLSGGEGADHLYGGTGADTFLLTALDGLVDTVHDFARGAGGDVIDISDLLQGFDLLSDALSDFVRIVDAGGGNAALEVNTDGASAFQSVAVLLGGTGGASATDLLADGQLIVA